ncbi:MAG: glycosyltransferase family 39 protein [Bacteroidales bacterium]|nr:glycosyltransferase family 39 protein [Bacteroidales bacterium]
MLKQSTFISNKFLIPLVFIFALILRLWNIEYSFSNDELSAVMRANYKTIAEIVSQGVLIDFHPAGIQVFITYWVRFFGNSEFAVRFPFAIFGSIASVFAFITARQKLGLTPAILTAIGVSVLEFSLLHGQLARPYSSGLMLIMIAYWLWNKVIFDANMSRQKLTLYSIALAITFAATAYNHYFSALSSVILAICGLFFIPKKRLAYYFGIGIFSAILFIPHINITLYHLSKGSIGSWLSPPKSDFLYTHIVHIFNDSLLLLLTILLSIVLYNIFSQRNKTTNLFKTRFVLLFLFLMPIAIGYIYSIKIGPVLQDRILLFNMPYLLMFIFSFVADNKVKKLVIIPSIIALLMILHTIFINKYYSTQHFINFKTIAKECSKTKIDNIDILRIQNSNSKNYLQYYLKDTTIEFATYLLNSEENIEELKIILDTSNAEYCEFINLRPISNLSKLMISSSFWELEKDVVDIWQNGYSLYNKSNILPSITNSSNTLANIDYSSDTLTLKNIEYSKGLVYIADYEYTISINIQFQFIDSLAVNNALLVISSEGNNIEKRWSGYALHYFKKNSTNNYLKGNIKYQLSKDEKVNIYIWNPDKEEIRLVNYQIAINKYN